METFFTILIWLGSGFAFAVGVVCGAALMSWAKRDHTSKEMLAMQQEVNVLLRERNDLGHKQAVALENIAAVLSENFRLRR